MSKQQKEILLDPLKFKCQTLSNADDSRTLKQHIFKPKVCREQCTGEEYDGNVSLCGKIWCSEDGEHAQEFLRMDNENFNDENCCKTCFKILTTP